MTRTYRFILMPFPYEIEQKVFCPTLQSFDYHVITGPLQFVSGGMSFHSSFLHNSITYFIFLSDKFQMAPQYKSGRNDKQSTLNSDPIYYH